MGRFILQRMFFLLVTLVFTSLLIFGLTWLLPGDPCQIKLQRDATPERLALCRAEEGLDKPVWRQYTDWTLGFVQGDWGESFFDNAAIYPDVMQRLENSGRLGLLVLLISVPLSIFLGVIAGLNENNAIDGVISVASLALVSLPEFVTGIFLIRVVAQDWSREWAWLPFQLQTTATNFNTEMGFYDALPFLILPALAATLVLMGYIARLTRAGVIEELKRDYVRTAELKGLPYWLVIVKHVLRNALLPTVTVIAISIGWLVSGLVVIEWVFNYPGLGRLLVFAVQKQDLPRIQAITMVSVLVILLANFVADVLYGVLNPRIRLGSQ